MQSDAPNDSLGAAGEPPITAQSPRRTVLAALVLLALGLIQPGPEAQEPERDGAAAGERTLEELLRLHHREEEAVRLVLLPTVVTTKKGRPVLGLDARRRCHRDQQR